MSKVATLPEVESILTIHIDGRWSASEFSILFDSINRLHDFQTLLDSYSRGFDRMYLDFDQNTDVSRLPQFVSLRREMLRKVYISFNQLNVLEAPKRQDDFPVWMFRDDELKVKSIKYGSKGSIDLAGFGKALEVIKDFIIHYFPNEEKKVDILLKKKQLEEKDQEILEKRIKNLKRMGFSQSETMSILGMESFQLNNIIELKEKGQIIGIELKDEAKR